MKTILRWILSVAVALLFLLPLLWVVQRSFLPESVIFERSWGVQADWGVSNYIDAWRRAKLGWGLINSLLQVFLIVGCGLLINSMIAFAFARLHFPGRDILFLVVLLGLILPVEVLVVPLFLTVRDLHLIGGYWGTMGALTIPFMAKAFNIFFLRQHFLTLPAAMEESALLDGAGWFRIYWNIALPSIKPALATVVVLDVLYHWADFIWPLVVCTRAETRTVQLSLSNLFTQPPVQYGDILACAVMASLPVMLIFRFAQKHIVMTHTDVSEK